MKRRVSTFELNDLLPIALTFIVAGIGIAYGLNVIGELKSDLVAEKTLTATCNTTDNGGTGAVTGGCGSDVNATSDSIDAVAKIPDKIPLIVTVVVAALIIGILVRFLMVRYA